MSLLKIAGKTDADVAKPFRVNASGDAVIERDLNTTLIDIITNLELRDTDAHQTALDNTTLAKFTGSAIKSVRIFSTLDQPVKFWLLDDYHKPDLNYLCRLDDVPITFTIPAQTYNRRHIITPHDIPELDYLHYVKFTFKAEVAPTSGLIKAVVVTKS